MTNSSGASAFFSKPPAVRYSNRVVSSTMAVTYSAKIRLKEVSAELDSAVIFAESSPLVMIAVMPPSPAFRP